MMRYQWLIIDEEFDSDRERKRKRKREKVKEKEREEDEQQQQQQIEHNGDMKKVHYFQTLLQMAYIYNQFYNTKNILNL